MENKKVKKPRKFSIRENKLMIIMVFMLIASLFYIAYNEYNKFLFYNQQQLREAAVIGYQKGVSDTVQKLFKETDTCQPVPIYVGNKTKNVISLDCLQITPTNSTVQRNT